jgi:hypothetical protein
MMAQTGSVYLTVCVTLERFVAVCRPLQAKSLCTYGRLVIGLNSLETGQATHVHAGGNHM